MTVLDHTVSHLWATPVSAGRIDLTGILHEPITFPEIGSPCQQLPATSVLADPDTLTAELLTSINTLTEAEGIPPVDTLDIEVQLWRAGYDQPAASHPAAYVAWCVLAASAARHAESGALTLADPRAGSALTAMPGLPWGRQMIINPSPGVYLAAPGWLTHSVVPLADGQHIVVAIASSPR
ncbi:hypothetical protein [Parafrankia sp. BMG5.11]|uniref:hypothetical protein n=1 Tax=Parafrankia sp. BMG5.11 TaxID=222540 RepID=UPI00103B32CA|nr:hypothetical protein [Parafrankia sp. BMG5.11]TCJ36582.1 hypothetical protein E0504_22895 [Parafrankia sp. BMG5.11]